MNLNNLVLVTKDAEVAFPGKEDFKVTVAAVSRELSKKIRTESEVTKIDPRAKIPFKELDEDMFLAKFAAAAIKGWKGLKYKDLTDLMLINPALIEDEEAEVEFNLDNAITLIKHSPAFDNWINEVVFNLELFRN